MGRVPKPLLPRGKPHKSLTSHNWSHPRDTVCVVIITFANRRARHTAVARALASSRLLAGRSTPACSASGGASDDSVTAESAYFHHGLSPVRKSVSDHVAADVAVFDLDVRECERERCRAANHLALVVVLRAVARAHELVLGLVPRDDAAKVGADGVAH